MRFLFEFVSCCGLPTQQPPEPAIPAAEEERSLVPATVSSSAASSRRPCQKRQRRMSAAEWRPSLGSISEDIVVPPREGPRKSAVASTGRDVKKRNASGSGAANVRRSYSERYYGQAALPTAMPTFSPTPFMF